MTTHRGRRTVVLAAVAALGGTAIAAVPVAVSAATVEAAQSPAITQQVGASVGAGLAMGRGGGAGNGQGAGQGQGNGRGHGAGADEHMTAVPAGSLGTPSAQLATELNYLRQEEKLAHDLYVLADSLYGAQQFGNIAQAEVNHGQAINALLAGYSMSDPTAGQPVGVFTDPQIQKLYDELAARVRQSQDEAAQVGILAEQTDIADLKETIATSPPAAVKTTLDHLVTASERHLQAFTRIAG